MEDSDTDGPVSRRGFLRTAAGTAAAAGAAGTAAAQEGGGGGGGGGTTVTVGPGGELTYDPETASVSPGGKVTFQWESGGHNVVPESGDWGHEPLEDSGFSFTATFDEAGSFPYFCQPHKSAGMEGTIEVGSGGGGGGSESVLPNSAKTLGIAAMSFMLSTLGLAYFFIRYGGDYVESTEE